eukprot:SRR837773.12089.p1 GENE.SRR837773.12089~~SRR837773.12089.p1  ORF type:complete len:343 (+),score=88.41 SRR837773.12089:35-1030(+)
MGLLGEIKNFCLWVFCSALFLDFQWPWCMPWNWHPRDLLEEIACNSPEGRAAESTVNSGVKVILPSVGQTGTTSVVAALAELGLRTYHIEEQLAFIRPALLEDANASTWARHVSRCRVEAIALEPLVDLFPLALQTSPNAKVILTWRDFRSWGQSTKAGGVKDLRWHYITSIVMASSARMLPWLSLYDRLTGRITEVLSNGTPFHGLGQASLLEMFCFYSFFRFIYGHPDSKVPFRGTNKVASGEYPYIEEAYLAQMDEIRRLTPPERLLIFDVRKDGWNKVTRFLGLPDQPEGRPFPHPRSKKSFTNDAVWDHAALGTRVVLVSIFFALQ